jgi:O-antigen ligase
MARSESASLVQALVSAGLLLYAALLPWSATAAAWALGMVAVSGLLSAAHARQAFSTVPLPARWALGLMSALGLCVIIMVKWQDQPWHLAVRGVRLLLMPLVMVALLVWRPSLRMFAWGCILGALGSGLCSVLDLALLDEPRARGHDWWTTWGMLGLMLGVLGGGLLLDRASPAGVLDRIGGGLGLIGAGATVLLSGSRGVWIAAGCVALAILWTRRREQRARASGIAVLATLATTLLVPGLRARWLAAVQDVSLFLHGDIATSLGWRFAMWREAGFAWLERPLFGSGPGGFRMWLAGRAAAGQIDASLTQFSHPHQDLLNWLVSGGMLGACIWMAMLGCLWWAFDPRRTTSSAARTGRYTVLAIIVAGTNDTYWDSLFLATFMAASLVMLLAWTHHPDGHARRPKV